MKWLLFLTSCLFTINVSAQKIPYGKSKYFQYLNEDYAELQSKEGAAYVRMFYGIDSLKPHYEVRDYTIDGKLMFIATSSSKEYLLFDGPCTYFNSLRKPLMTGNYTNSKPSGDWLEYYNNGQIKLQLTYSDGTKLIHNSWDSLGHPEVKDDNGLFVGRDSAGTVVLKGAVKNGWQEGKWEGYDKDGKLFYEEKYFNGKLVKGSKYLSDGTIVNYDVEEQTPTFPGGEKRLYKFLRDVVEYPRDAFMNGTEGTVVVQFVVDEEGQPTKVAIHAGVSTDLNIVALRTVKLMPKWKSGKNRGVTIPLLMRLPISFHM
jgi:TonB family protein